MKRAFCLIAATVLGSLALISAAFGQASQSHPYSYLSTATTNATLVYGGASLLQNGIIANTTGTVYYLKLYDKRTAPVCNTDVPKWRIPVPINTTVSMSVEGLKFDLGVGFCLTGGIADNDNTNAATGLTINFGIAWIN